MSARRRWCKALASTAGDPHTAIVMVPWIAALAALLLACDGAADTRDPNEARLRGLPATAERTVERPALLLHALRVSAPSGGGDAILVADSSAERARHVLIDAGDDASAARALGELGVTSLDLMVLTHAHHDHYGGMADVLDAVPVRTFAFNGQARSAVTYRRLLRRIDEEVRQVLVVESVRRVRLGQGIDATELVLLPPMDEFIGRDTDRSEPLNEGSLGVRVARGRFSFLSTGDAELRANRRFAAVFPEQVAVDVLKLGHHGSSDATQPFWLDATAPEAAIVSANGTTHPHGRVLELVRARGIDLYCTPQHGRVTIRVARAGDYAVRTAASPRLPCEPGSER